MKHITVLFMMFGFLPMMGVSCSEREPRNPDGSVGKPYRRPVAATDEEEKAIKELEMRMVRFVYEDPMKMGHRNPQRPFWSAMLDRADTDELRTLKRISNLESLSVGSIRVEDMAAVFELRGLRTLIICDVGDMHLRGIAALKELTWLGLVQTGVTDEGLKEIEDLSNLRHLYLDGTKVTNEGMRSVAKLIKLEFVGLSDTLITDEAIDILSNCREVRRLGLENTNIGDLGLKHCQRFPKLAALEIAGCINVTDKGLEFLESVGSLKSLSVDRRMRVSGQGLVKLEKSNLGLSISGSRPQ